VQHDQARRSHDVVPGLHFIKWILVSVWAAAVGFMYQAGVNEEGIRADSSAAGEFEQRVQQWSGQLTALGT
jgi:hypothetical protein